MTSDSSSRQIRIATRESPLALWQANFVRDELRRIVPDWTVELHPVTTGGDKDRLSALSTLGGVGVFTREVQRAVLAKEADLAVHSLKDLPTEEIPELTLAGIPQRESRFDALVFPIGERGGLADLPDSAIIGTGSLRRRAQLLALRPDLQLVEIRGNVETRLEKLDRGEFQAIVLAEAGLLRLGRRKRISQSLRPPLMYPAVGQAALGIECRSEDLPLIAALARLSDPATFREVLAERACLRTLRAGCHAPVGVLTSLDGADLSLQAVVISPDGRKTFRASHVTNSTDPEQPERLGIVVAEKLLDAGADAVLGSVGRN